MLTELDKTYGVYSETESKRKKSCTYTKKILFKIKGSES